MAWIDLLYVTESVAREIGRHRCLPLLLQYGFDEQSALGFIGRLKSCRPSKHTRNRHRSECELRELIARARP